jgi:hypothetical protein
MWRLVAFCTCTVHSAHILLVLLVHLLVPLFFHRGRAFVVRGTTVQDTGLYFSYVLCPNICVVYLDTSLSRLYCLPACLLAGAENSALLDFSFVLLSREYL